MSSLPGCFRLVESNLPSAFAGMAETGFESSFGLIAGSLAEYPIGATAGTFSSTALPFLAFVGNCCSVVSVVEGLMSATLSSFFDLTTSATLRAALVDPDLATGLRRHSGTQRRHPR